MILVSAWYANARFIVLAHERLSIVGVGMWPPVNDQQLEDLYANNILSDSGAQPLVNDDSSLALAVNGEIYNHRLIRKNLHHKYNFKTHSDCEVIIPLVCQTRYSGIGQGV